MHHSSKRPRGLAETRTRRALLLNHHCRRYAGAAAAAVLLSLPVVAAAQGGVFVTGHDPDYHAVQGSNTLGAKHIIQDALAFTT